MCPSEEVDVFIIAGKDWQGNMQYYSGASARFVKDIRQAKLYKTAKGAMRAYPFTQRKMLNQSATNLTVIAAVLSY